MYPSPRLGNDLGVAKLAPHHEERVLDLGSPARLGFLDIALGVVQRAALIQLLVSAAAGRNLPDDFTTFMFAALPDARVARVCAAHVLRRAADYGLG